MYQSQQEPSPRPFPFQLQDVRIYEVSATVEVGEFEEDASLPLEVGLVSDEAPPEAEEFGLLLTFGTSKPVGPQRAYAIHIAIEGRFQLIPEAEPPSVELVERFRARDAIVLLWPYLRQALHDLTTRMRIDMAPLPVIDARALVQTAREERQPDS